MTAGCETAAASPADLGLLGGGSRLPPTTPTAYPARCALPRSPLAAYAEIAPLPLKGDAESTLNRLAGIIETLDGEKECGESLGTLMRNSPHES